MLRVDDKEKEVQAIEIGACRGKVYMLNMDFV
jgi:hypothetical protein